VFISSIDGPTITHIGNSMYAASKGAVTAIAKTMAVELASKKIRVNCILPGMTETPLIHTGDITQEQLDHDMLLYPLKRYGKPEEIAYAAVYFLSKASAWTTGANLIIDGGFTLL
jgi:NAD(P)-dependent dehydrogenase (short-subunit alcohol dehydrogenase family)